MIHSDDKLKTYFRVNWINDSWRKNFDEQERSKWFRLELLFFDIHNHQHPQIIVLKKIQGRKRPASNVDDFFDFLSIKISRIEELENDENTSIFRQQSSVSTIQKNLSKNFMNINVRENEDFLTRSKSFELCSRLIQMLTRIRTAREIQDRHLSIQFRNSSSNSLALVALIAQVVKDKKSYESKTYAEVMTDNYHKMNW